MANQSNRKTLGRYDFDRAREPAGGIAPPPPSEAVRRKIGAAEQTERVAVPDPWDARGRLEARARHDLLDIERRHGYISEAAYIEGRKLQAVFERASLIAPASNWEFSGKSDPVAASGLMAERWVRAGGELASYKATMRREGIGDPDIEILCMVLGRGLGYAAVAAWRATQAARRRGDRVQRMVGDRQVRYIAARFRDALEFWADKQAARGPDRGRIRGYGSSEPESDSEQASGA